MCPIHGYRGCPAFNTHHQFWPRRNYKSKLEKQFRQLHTVKMCVEAHVLLHVTTPPPKKPSAEAMRRAIAVKLEERNGRDSS